MCTQEGPDHHLDPLGVDFHSYGFSLKIIYNVKTSPNLEGIV